MANSRCRLHGGLTPVGPSSNNWRTGKYSKWGLLPRELAEHYARAIAQADAVLMALTQELALLDARVSEIVATLGSEGETDPARWSQILELFETRRRLVEAESKRRKETQETLSLAQALAIVERCGAIVKKFIRDPTDLSEAVRSYGR